MTYSAGTAVVGQNGSFGPLTLLEALASRESAEVFSQN
jgi:hypothetical protein